MDDLGLVLCGIIAVVASSCPNGWMIHGLNCYHFSHDKEDFPGAVKMCQLIGGSLVEINNADENNFIAGQVVARHNFEPFVALTDVVQENVFVWIVSGTQVTNVSYTNWGDSQPNNVGGDENCVVIRTHGQWYDDQCYYSHNYICERTEGGKLFVEEESDV